MTSLFSLVCTNETFSWVNIKGIIYIWKSKNKKKNRNMTYQYY